MLGTDDCRVGWWTWGIYPRISSYGAFLVVLDGQEFLTYWASGNHSAHE
jgi:hypothetical protein